MQIPHLLLLLAVSASAASCGGDTPTDPPTGLTLAARVAAATATAQRSPGLCSDIRPYYWEIGDGTGRLASGSVNQAGNATTVAAATVLPIASASKWIYGAYVAERRAGLLTAEDISFLTFRSGYTNFAVSGCENGETVGQCATRPPNGDLTAANVGRFSYDGAHMQTHASLPAPGMDLGPYGSVALALEMRSVLGTEIGLTYTQPQLAGGVRSSAADYATFLRKILNGQLRIASLLGGNATCTNPQSCATAVNTPITSGDDWNYSIGHWVEADPQRGDGAFSSAGAFGFYPWIDSSRTWYGVISRFAALGGGNESAECGALIRRAWVTGVAR